MSDETKSERQPLRPFVLPEIPDGVHPWVPAEEDARVEYGRVLSEHSTLARECAYAAGDLIALGQGRRDPLLFQVHASLAIRVLQDLRACEHLSICGYTMQAWTNSAAAFEAAHAMGFIGDNVDRAKRWFEHDSEKDSFVDVKTSIDHTMRYLIESEFDADQQSKLARDAYEVIYRQLAMAKHANPISERHRHIVFFAGEPSFLLTPVYSPRRAAEARIGLLLALRSAHVALWVMDVTHVHGRDDVDSRLLPIATKIADLVNEWRSDLEIVLADETKAHIIQRPRQPSNRTG